MDELNDQIEQRLKKLDRLRSLGIEPFGAKFDVKDRAGDVIARHGTSTKEALEQQRVTATVAGRVIALRRFGKAAFASIQDGIDTIQVYLKKDLLGESGYALAELLDIGDWIGVTGPLFRTKTNELTIEVNQLTLLSKALRPLPEKWHGLTDVETRYRQRYVDLIANPEVKLIFITRSRIIQAIRTFLVGKGFLEVETPMMHQIPGGATARPFVTHHNTLGTDLYLSEAKKHRCELKGGESYWQLMVLLFGQVVEPTLIQPTFITDFPVEISPLAKRKARDPELTDRFELYIATREIANAFSELNDPMDQRRRFEAQMAERAKGALAAQRLDEDFLRALEHGMPPTAGEGIGVDRLAMLLTNQTPT